MKKWLFIILAFLPFHLLSQLRDLAHDQRFVIYDTISDGYKVGWMQSNANWDTVSTITYSILNDSSGIFNSSGNYIIIDDALGIQASKTYWLQFTVSDGSFKDTANAYIYVADGDSLINWNDNYDNFQEGYYYVFKCGETYQFDETVTIDAEDVTFISWGSGSSPVIEGNQSASSSSMIKLNAGNFEVRGLEFQQTDNSNCHFGIRATDPIDNVCIDNCVFIGSDNINYMWYNVFRSDNGDYVSNNWKILNCNTQYSFGDMAFFMNMNTFQFIGNIFTYLGYEYDGVDYGLGGDCIQFALDTDCKYIYYRYNYTDHTSNPYKHGIVLGSTNGLACYDTIMDSRFIGYQERNSFAFNGITSDGSNYIYITRNYFKNCDRGVFLDEHDVTHIVVENNIFDSCYVGAFGSSVGMDYTYFYNNTIYSCGDYSGEIMTNNNANNCKIKNNIFYNQSGVEPFTDVDYTDIDYNIYLNRESHTLNTNEIEDNPDFNNAINSDFSLQDTSPAIDEADNISIYYDYFGVYRGATPDMGAIEYVTTEPITIYSVTYKGLNLNDATYKGQSFSTIKYKGVTYKQ